MPPTVSTSTAPRPAIARCADEAHRSDRPALAPLVAVLVLHFAFQVELSADPGGVKQLSMHIEHRHTCLAVGHYLPPRSQLPDTKAKGLLREEGEVGARDGAKIESSLSEHTSR